MSPEIPRPVKWRSLDGVVLLDKPVGLTSNQALQSVRRLLGADKGGHTGTLDPFATGVLPLCLGEATKFSADLLNADKTYEATVAFGQCTDTGDLTGTVVNTTDVLPRRAQLENVLKQFLGESEQIPPMYSALKRDGQPLYKLARAGVVVERMPRKIYLSELRWIHMSYREADRVAVATLTVRCSKGTYIRTLAEDMAIAVGSLAHLIALRRVQVGDVTLSGCHTLSALAQADSPGVLSQMDRAALFARGLLQPVDFLVQALDAVHISKAQYLLCRHGNAFEADTSQQVVPEAGVRIYYSGQFLGLGKWVQLPQGMKIQPMRLVALTDS